MLQCVILLHRDGDFITFGCVTQRMWLHKMLHDVLLILVLFVVGDYGSVDSAVTRRSNRRWLTAVIS